jgi:phosphatidylethanolamine-binding protein (PEBP) family uncharacterized protein
MDSRRSATDGRALPARSVRCALRTSAAACALAALAASAVAGCGESSGSSTQSVAQSTRAASSPTAPGSFLPGSSAARPPAAGSHSNGAGTTAAAPATPGATPTAKAPKGAIPSAKSAERVFNLLGLGGMHLTSSAFSPGGPIATRYTCDGAGMSPQIHWHGAPSRAAQLFLYAGDLGGGASTTVQWAVAMPANTTEIPAGSLPPGAVVGVNSAGQIGWGGVCGARGVLQHVTFLLYALRHPLSLQSGFNSAQARSALKGNTLGTGFTLATYQR